MICGCRINWAVPYPHTDTCPLTIAIQSRDKWREVARRLAKIAKAYPPDICDRSTDNGHGSCRSFECLCDPCDQLLTSALAEFDSLTKEDE